MNEKIRTKISLYAQVFNNEAGRAVLLDMIKAFHDRSSFVPSNPYETAFREGQRDVVLRICRLARLRFDPIMQEIKDGQQ